MTYAIIAYNNTIHSSTHFTPYELVFGHTDSRDPMDLVPTHVYTEYVNSHKNNTHALYNQIARETQEQKEKIIDKANRNKTPTELIIGSTHYKNRIIDGEK